MENENKDWKPEVGKTAWLKRYPYTIEQVMIIADCSTKLHYRQNYSIGEGEVAEYYSAQDRDYFFESPEAALASIKIYDLEGKEVVIPPRPLVLEPKPLEWSHYQDGTALASDGDWLFYADDCGDWNIKLNGVIVGIGSKKDGNMDSAKAAIQEWRVNHLKSMLP